MVDILVQQTITAAPKTLLKTLLAHEQLARFFNAKFSILRAQNGNEIVGGEGCVREVKMLGINFQEQITHASANEIRYQIISKFPLKQHCGSIKFLPLEQDSGSLTRVEYRISFQVPWYLPSRLVERLVTVDIQRALHKLKEHFDAS